MRIISSPSETSLKSMTHRVAGVTEAANGVAGVTEAANGAAGVRSCRCWADQRSGIVITYFREGVYING